MCPPTHQDSRAVYAERMHRVLAAIDEKIDQPLDLASLAQVAHFSEFHFHRLFAAWMGETLGAYLRRRRLEVAAQRLVAQPRLSVLAVALSVGWGSGEAFARARAPSGSGSGTRRPGGDARTARWISTTAIPVRTEWARRRNMAPQPPTTGVQPCQSR
jgi:AraC family transcriptional regulator